MKNTRLSRRAERDLIAILRYSSRNFGLKHASDYILELRRVVRLIGENPGATPFYRVEKNMRRKIYKAHCIYYSESPTEIVIIRILDARRDTRKHL